MATLEKIRSKSVFLIVVIGVALLAFIVGDALTNSRNILGDHTTVAKVGSTKIDYTDYQRKREELNQQLEEARRNNPQQVANFDTQVLPEMALEQLVQDGLLNAAADKAGIKTSGNILRHYMIDNPRSQEVMDIVRQLNAAGLGVQTPQQAYEVIFNPKRNGLTEAQAEPFQRAWLAAEKKMDSQIRQQTYQRLLAGTVRPNDLDKQALYNDYVNTANVVMAFLPFGNLNEKEYPVTPAELKEKYNKVKNRYRVDEPTKQIAFIAVNVAPSDADQAKSKELAAKTLSALSNRGQLPKDLKKEGVGLTHYSRRAADIPAGTTKDFVTTASGDSAKIVYDNIQGFLIVRPTGTSQAIDSIQVNFVTTATEALGQKVLAQLNGGLPADSLAVRFPADSVASQLNEWIPLYTADGPTNAVPEATLDSLLASQGKYIVLQQGAQGMAIAKVVKQNAPVTIYEYDEAQYTLGPSQQTRTDERSKLEKFLGANNTAEKFMANAAKAGYNLQEFTLTSSAPAVPRFPGMNQYYPESRQVVRWVMIDGEKGEVSHIYNSQDALHPAMYAAAVIEAYDDFVPLADKNVNKELTDEIRASKAGDKLVGKYSKNTQSIAGVAQAMGVEPREIPSVRFSANSGIPDANVAGRIAGTTSKKVNLLKGSNGVYAFQVTGNAKENFNYNDEMYSQQYYQFVNPDLMKMIQGNRKVQNNIYKFEAGD